jgi:threonine/homoserine/homoserine lactone efflux protein
LVCGAYAAHDMLFGIPHFWLFALSVLLINITPGATFLTVSSNAVTKGIKAGILTTIGADCALLMYAFFCWLGLSAIITGSPFLFNTVRYAGAAYLFYCAIKAFLQKPFDISRVNTNSNSDNFKKGFLVNLLNPFTPVLFLTLIPQFIAAGAGTTPVLFMGLWICFSALVVNLVWAFLFGFAGKWLVSKPGFWKWQGIVTGLLFLYLAVRFVMK